MNKRYCYIKECRNFSNHFIRFGTITKKICIIHKLQLIEVKKLLAKSRITPILSAVAQYETQINELKEIKTNNPRKLNAKLYKQNGLLKFKVD